MKIKDLEELKEITEAALQKGQEGKPYTNTGLELD